VKATALLLRGQLAPLLLLAVLSWLPPLAAYLAFLATQASFYSRFAGAKGFRQSWLGACLRLAGIMTFLAIQWHAFIRSATRQPSGWKGRVISGAFCRPTFPGANEESTDSEL